MGGGCGSFRALDVESPLMAAKWIYSTTRRIRYGCQPNYLVTRFTTYPLATAYQHTEFFILFFTLQKNFCSAKSLFIRVDSIIYIVRRSSFIFFSANKEEPSHEQANMTKKKW